MKPDLYTVDVVLYGPFGELGYAPLDVGGRFDIDLNEEFTRTSCADLLGRFIREQAAKHEWPDFKATDLVAGAQFPMLESEWVHADFSGREVIES